MKMRPVSTPPGGPEPSLSQDAMDAVAARLAEQGRLIESGLQRFLAVEESSPQVVRAMRHGVFAGGARLRPVLVLGGAEVAGAAADDVLPTACAVELIHTYSLIHDDLSVMDSSPARGRPACHVFYGEAFAVLAGDALHALAFELLARNAAVPGIPAGRVVRAITDVTRSIGTRGMVGGQALDVLAHGGGGADVHEIHRLKTGSLIQACVRVGGILGGAPEADLDALSRYGAHLGTAFQIVDEILDIGEETKLGKGPGSDAAGAKLTFPSVFGLAASRQMAQDATAQAMLALAPLGDRGRWLRDLAAFLLSRDR